MTGEAFLLGSGKAGGGKRMGGRRSRLIGIALTSAFAASCSRTSPNNTSTEGRPQHRPAFTAEERSVGDVDAGTPALVSGAKKPVQAAPRKISAEFRSRVTEALSRGKGYDLIVELKSEATQGQQGLRQTTTASQALKNARAALVQNSGAQLKQEFGHLPFVMVQVDTLAAFNAVMAHQDVARVHENQELEPLANVDTVIGRTTAATTINYNGVSGLGSYNASGTQTAVNIALVDGTVNTSAVGLTGAGLVTLSGLSDSVSAHATALAGAIHAMAPAANIYDEVITTSGVATTASLLTGLGHLSTIHATHPLSAVVIAFGSAHSYANASDCAAGDGGAFASAITSLRSLGIVAFAAAGNAANFTSMPAPACLANVVSVGATQGPYSTSSDYLSTGSTTCLQSTIDKDARLCNSNASTDTDLLAPGFTYECSGGTAAGKACMMDSDCTGGGTCKVLFHCDGNGIQGAIPAPPAQPTYVASSVVCTSSGSCGTGGKCIPTSPYGTSIAAANAAAAYAIVRGFGLPQTPAESAERALNRLTDGGVIVVDPRNSKSVPVRIQLDAALPNCVGPAASPTSLSFNDTGAPSQTVTIDTDPGCGAGTQCAGGPTPGTLCSIDSDCGAGGTCSAAIQSDAWITANVDTVARTGSIGATANNGSERIGTVTLYGANISVDQTGDITPPAGGTLAITTPSPTTISSKSWITTGTVTLTNTATGSPTQMCFANVAGHCDTASTHKCDAGNVGDACSTDSDCLPAKCEGTWVAYAATKSGYALSAGSGDKMVEGWYKDAAGNVSTGVLTTVSVDSIAPSNGSLTAALDTSGSSPALSIKVASTTDSGVGIGASNNLKIASALGTTAPANCNSGSLVSGNVSGSTITYSLTSGLTLGSTYSFRVCAVDALGNVSTGMATTAIKIVADAIVPVGTLTLSGTGGFAGYSTTTAATGSVTMTSADDTTAPRSVYVCISTTALDGTANCTGTGVTGGGWQAVSTTTAATANITLATGDGVKTYNYKFKDATPNISAVKQATIKLDTATPKAGTVTGASLDNYDAKITWSGFSDTAFPIAQYNVYAANGGTAPGCTGTPIYTGTAATTTDTVPVAAGTRSYTVCAKDGVGRQVSSNLLNVAIKLEVTPPVIGATVVLPTCSAATLCYGSGKYTKDTTPPIQVKVNDVHINGGALCFATTNSTTGCSWQTVTGVASQSSTGIYSPTKALVVGSTAQNYYVFAKDSIGNVSPATAVAVNIDTVGPVFSSVALTKVTTTSAKLAWTVSDGAGSGLATASTYTIRYAMGTATAAPTAPSCTSGGTAIALASNVPGTLNYTKTAMTTNRYYTFALCAKDNLGNISTVQRKTLLLK